MEGLRVLGNATEEQRAVRLVAMIDQPLLALSAASHLFQVLGASAISFLAALMRQFNPERLALLEGRLAVHQKLLRGSKLAFRPDTASVRLSEWKVAPLKAPVALTAHVVAWRPASLPLLTEAVELGQGVQVDFDDAFAPLWSHVLDSQVTLRALATHANVARLIVRPRALNLIESHITVDGVPCAGALVDFSLWMESRIRHGSPVDGHIVLYLPKEAAWWAKVFRYTEEHFSLPLGTLRAIIHIENIRASFELHEILHALREHCVSLNTGKWDYLFSYLKLLRGRSYVPPDRAALSQAPLLSTYEAYVIHVCRMRGAHVTGGMTPLLPSENIDAQMAQISDGALKGYMRGLEGALVAHPAFANAMHAAYISNVVQEPAPVPSEDELAEALVEEPYGDISPESLTATIQVVFHYIAHWLNGEGAAVINGSLEDLATAEISRTLLWLWVHHGAKLSDGTKVTASLVAEVVEVDLKQHAAKSGLTNVLLLECAARLVSRLLAESGEEMTDFLPSLLYPLVVEKTMRTDPIAL